jgi:hypothetical protein
VPRARCPHWAGAYESETRSAEGEPGLPELLDPARRTVLVAHDNRCLGVSFVSIPIRRAFSRSPLLSTNPDVAWEAAAALAKVLGPLIATGKTACSPTLIRSCPPNLSSQQPS